MNTPTMQFNTVSVQFVGQTNGNKKEYAYLTNLNLKDGDLVVCDTTYGYKTAKVVSMFCDESNAHKWIVCQVDVDKFKIELDEMKRKQLVYKMMKQRLGEMDLMTEFAKIAENRRKLTITRGRWSLFRRNLQQSIAYGGL